MAKIKYGAIVTDGRGKVGNYILSRNHYGSYVRENWQPVAWNSPNQIIDEAYFNTLVTLWQGLSDAQRQSFADGAYMYSRNNVFGDKKVMSGYNLFMRLNKNLLMCSRPTLSQLPGFENTPSFIPVNCYAHETLSELMFSFDQYGTGSCKIKVFATVNLSPGRNTPAGFFRFIKIIDSTDIQPVNIFTEYTSRTWVPTAPVFNNNDKIFIQLQGINSNTGAESHKTYSFLTITEGVGNWDVGSSFYIN